MTHIPKSPSSQTLHILLTDRNTSQKPHPLKHSPNIPLSEAPTSSEALPQDFLPRIFAAVCKTKSMSILSFQAVQTAAQKHDTAAKNWIIFYYSTLAKHLSPLHFIASTPPYQIHRNRDKHLGLTDLRIWPFGSDASRQASIHKLISNL